MKLTSHPAGMTCLQKRGRVEADTAWSEVMVSNVEPVFICVRRPTNDND